MKISEFPQELLGLIPFSLKVSVVGLAIWVGANYVFETPACGDAVAIDLMERIYAENRAEEGSEIEAQYTYTSARDLAADTYSCGARVLVTPPLGDSHEVDVDYRILRTNSGSFVVSLTSSF